MHLATFPRFRSAGVRVILICFFCVSTLAAASQTSPSAPNPDAQTPGNTSTAQPQTAPSQPPSSTPPPPTAPRQAGGQDPLGQSAGGDDQESMFVFKKQVEEVVLHATVVDDRRVLVPNLDRSAFSVFQDGAPQTVTSFRREDVPVALGIVIDNSGSMRDKREKVNQSVMNLIRASNPQDEIFVVNFSQSYYLDQDFTSNPNWLEAALHQVSMKGSTALYDAVVASAVHLQNNPRLDKKVLLVITDGCDNMSQETLQEAARRLQRSNGPTLYAVGLLGGGMSSTGRAALQSLADATGGVAFFPETLDQVDEITRTVARDIRSQYTIAYKPQNQNTKPAYQSIRVEARAPGYGSLLVRTRSGYYGEENAR